MAIVYTHIRKDSKEIFYVGIGKNKGRAYSQSNRNKHWRQIVTKVGYEVVIFKEDITWEEACILEKNLIKEYGRRDLMTGTLVNMTDGGEGIENPSAEVREKLRYKKSDAHKQLLREYQKGVKQSKETIEKRLSHNFHQTEEYRQKQRESHLGKPRSEETKQKLRKPKPPRTEEHSKKISEAKKGKPSHMKGTKKSPAWNFEEEIKTLRALGYSLEKLRKHFKCGESTLLKILSN
jgi:hypothetical protein